MSDHPTASPRRPDTAVVFPVPELAPLLDRVAEHRPDAVRPGIPPHLSVCYPFLPRTQVTPAVRDDLRAELLGYRPGRIRLDAPISAPGILYSSPRPSDVIDDLAARLERRWPALAADRAARDATRQPIGTHLTVALGADDAHDALSRLVADWFPRLVDLTELWLLARTDGGWEITESLPLPI